MEAQKLVNQCRFQEAIPCLTVLLNQTENFYLHLGIFYHLFICYLLEGDQKMVAFCISRLSLMRSQDFPKKKDCEAMFLDLESLVTGSKVFLKESIVDPCYSYVPEALGYLNIINIYQELSKGIVEKNIPSPTGYVLAAAHFEEEGNLLTALSLHCYIAIMYKLREEKSQAIASIHKVLDLVKKTNYILLPVVTYHYLKGLFEEAIRPEEEEMARKLKQLEKSFVVKFLSFLLFEGRKNAMYYIFDQEDFQLLHYARGNMKNKEIATAMGISESAVSKKYSALYKKSHAKDKQELVELFMQSYFGVEKS